MTKNSTVRPKVFKTVKIPCFLKEHMNYYIIIVKNYPCSALLALRTFRANSLFWFRRTEAIKMLTNSEKSVMIILIRQCRWRWYTRYRKCPQSADISRGIRWTHIIFAVLLLKLGSLLLHYIVQQPREIAALFVAAVKLRQLIACLRHVHAVGIALFRQACMLITST